MPGRRRSRRHTLYEARPQDSPLGRQGHLPHRQVGDARRHARASTTCCRSCAGHRGPARALQAFSSISRNGRFYFFFLELWPQEVYYITGLLILAAFGLFLMNAVAGRVWCGYLCPQTVWTDLLIAVERLIEGDRRARI